ncbi:MAG: 6-pyruvoyl tetrahydrobiopterin synthase [Clostridiaceae bacterium]|nr:6-carboxytetrahydropterin synthase [Oscillospiraceae bacterium]NLO62236.1 6-pyruvoyl tetrahydrobiopterin synthase [Clostridiaceae bacterium]
MKYSQYNFKFYLNANHAIYLNGVLGQSHPHTWEISIEAIKIRDDFIQFDVIEKQVERYISAFQDTDINQTPPFDVINPTLENICAFFKDELNKLLSSNGWLLSRIEISETPARSYIIDLSDETDVIPDADRVSEEALTNIDAHVDALLQKILGD